MKLSNRVVEQVFGVLKSIGKQPMPMKLSWALKDFMDAFEPIVIRIAKTMGEMQEQFADRDANGKVVQMIDEVTGRPLPGTFTVSVPEKVEMVKREIAEMYDLETNFPELVPIPLSLFPDSFNISPEHSRTLKAIIDKDA